MNTNTNTNTGAGRRVEFVERGHRAAGALERDAFESVAREYYAHADARGAFVMWAGDDRSTPHRVELVDLLAGGWVSTALDYASAVWWDGDTFGLDMESGAESFRLEAMTDDESAGIPWPCLYTGGREECEHTGCREAHTGSRFAVDYAAHVAANGEPCEWCGAHSFMRCAGDACDAITCESCDGRGLEYCPEHVDAGDMLPACAYVLERLETWEREGCGDGFATLAAWAAYGRLDTVRELLAAGVDVPGEFVALTIDNARALYA